MKIYKYIIKKYNLLYFNFLNSRKFKKQIVISIAVIILLLLTWLMGYKQRDEILLADKYTIDKLAKDTSKLNQNLTEYELDLKAYNQIMEDNDYLRYMAFKHSDIVIPKHFNHEDLKLVYRLSIRFEIPQEYIYRLIQKESRFKPGLTSSAGAKGYMQIMPATYKVNKKLYEKKYGSIDSYNENQKNIIIGTFLLNKLWQKYHNWKLVFAAYNAGTGNVEKAGNRIPNIIETKKYVNFITKK